MSYTRSQIDKLENLRQNIIRKAITEFKPSLNNRGSIKYELRDIDKCQLFYLPIKYQTEEYKKLYKKLRSVYKILNKNVKRLRTEMHILPNRVRKINKQGSALVWNDCKTFRKLVYLLKDNQEMFLLPRKIRCKIDEVIAWEKK